MTNPVTVPPAVGMPPMIGQRLTIDQWLQYVAEYDFGTIPPSRVVLHHTYIPNLSQWRGLASMRGMQSFYGGKGWTAAPHMYVGPDGIWLFTPMRDVGIHAGIGNSGRINGRFWYSIGCEMVGDYDKEQPGGAVWQGTLAVLGGLSRRLDIAPKDLISFHRDYTNLKSCPGRAVQHAWVWAEVEKWIAINQPAPAAPAIDPAKSKQITGLHATHVCGAGFADLFEHGGGIPVFGLALSDEWSEADATGEICQWMRFENGIMKYKPSSPAGWQIRLASLDEIKAKGW